MNWKTWRGHMWWIIPLLVADYFFFRWISGCGVPPTMAPLAAPQAEPVAEAPLAGPWQDLGFPTAQGGLLDTNSVNVFQPTGSGRLESALYGSTRTVKVGGRLMSSFHEGIDIAPLQRDRNGKPLDQVFAVAQGHVAFINIHAGNSSYGKYVVVLHEDPIGRVYSLYAHLDAVATGLRTGQAVAPGTPLGVMGNTTTLGLPMERAHLHFEFGFIQNTRYGEWFRNRKLKPDMGMFNGQNLIAIDPLAVYRAHQADPHFTMRDHVATIPAAFTLLGNASRLPDFFKQHPALWSGPAYAGGPIFMRISENGLPLEGRAATPEEKNTLAGRRHLVANVDQQVLGRNGRHLISTTAQGNWTLGQRGEQWLEVLLF